MRNGALATGSLLALVWGAVSLAQAPPPAPASANQQQAAATAQIQASPPAGAASRVRFVGNTSFTQQDLRAALADPLQQIQNQGLSVPLADDTAYYLGVFYRRHGYPAADVTYKMYGNGQFLELEVREGRYYNLGQIDFKGDKAFPPAALNDYMIGTTRARFSQFQKQLPFVEADLVTGTSLVQGYYVSQGFPEVKIVKLETKPDEAHDVVNATVTIQEGPRYFFGPITFANDPEIPVTNFYAKFNQLTGQAKPYSEAELANLQRDLIFIYKKAGHYAATVEVSADLAHLPAGGRVPVRVTSNPGPVYRFGTVEVDQAPGARLKPDFLPQRFAELQGRTYSPDTVRDLNNEMVRTGLFDTLDLQETAEPDDTIRLTLSPREGRAKEFSVFGGYRTFDGAILGASYTNRNIGGEGHIVSVSLEYTGRGPSGEISYEDPWFLKTRDRLRLAVGLDQKQVEGYTYTEAYARASLTRKYLKAFETGAYVEARSVNLSDVTIDPPNLVGPTSYQLATVGLTHTIDMRDSAVNPRSGWILVVTASGSEPLQQASAFLRATERFSIYQSFGKGLLAAGVRFGVIMPSSGGTLGVPIEERFFNGGADTVRSYGERELGPRDNNNNPYGGLARSIFNLEYQHPLFGDLTGAVFFDAGGLGVSPFSNLSTAIGVGIRYNLPVGPLRIDYGLNPAPRFNPASHTRDPIGAFHLSFGFAF
ncbi:MAG TPA: BamA/TamA family outer membrane protein [Chthoniobacterales bacterium]